VQVQPARARGVSREYWEYEEVVDRSLKWRARAEKAEVEKLRSGPFPNPCEKHDNTTWLARVPTENWQDGEECFGCFIEGRENAAILREKEGE